MLHSKHIYNVTELSKMFDNIKDIVGLKHGWENFAAFTEPLKEAQKTHPENPGFGGCRGQVWQASRKVERLIQNGIRLA